MTLQPQFEIQQYFILKRPLREVPYIATIVLSLSIQKHGQMAFVGLSYKSHCKISSSLNEKTIQLNISIIFPGFVQRLL